MYSLDEHTVALLHFENGGVKDETGKVWTINGGAVVTNDQKKVGESSLKLDGSTGYLSTPITTTDFDFRGDFTVESWVYLIPGTSVLFSMIGLGKINVSATTLTRVFWELEIGNSTKNSIQINFGDVDGIRYNNRISPDLSSEISYGRWIHLATVRSNYIITHYVNGKSVYSASYPNQLVPSQSKGFAYIGTNNYDGRMTGFFSGYLDEIRISNIARWTEDFDPEPVKSNAILRVTMLDSSVRDYQLSTSEIAGIISWFNKKIGTQNSKEYLSFDKIISFEVLKLK